MLHSHAIRHVAAFIYLGLIALPVACSSSDDEGANASTGGTGGTDAGGSGGTAGSGGSGGSGAEGRQGQGREVHRGEGWDR